MINTKEFRFNKVYQSTLNNLLFTLLSIVTILGYCFLEGSSNISGTQVWETRNIEKCKMTINHPNELAIKEVHSKLEGNPDIEFYSNEPYIRLLIHCSLNNNGSNELSSSLTLINETTEVNDSEILMIKDEVMGYDDFLIENINTTK